MFATQLFAYPQTNRQQRNQRYEQIQSAKIAFFTAEIQLTPKEAEEFWPLYNQYWKERETLQRNAQHNLRAMGRILSSEEAVSDAELKKLIDNYVNNSTLEGEIHKLYLNRFLRILSVEKVARMYRAEENFRIKMIQQLRSGVTPPKAP